MLPDKEKMLEFVCRGLEVIPGVVSVDYSICQGAADEKRSSDKNCVLLHEFVIKSKDRQHGELLLKISDVSSFSPYIPFIENLISMLAIIFEERHQRTLKESILANLESQVNERTQELKVEIEERKKAEQKKEKLIKELKNLLANVKLLHGLLPICANCKDVRNDKGYYEQIEKYIADHSDVQFSHGICPKCAKKLYPEFYDENEDTGKQQSKDGYSNDDATKFDPDANLCITCKHNNGSSEGISCNLIGAKQIKESTSQCDDYKKQTY